MRKIYLPSLVTFLIGLIITILGALFKISHWPFASIMLTVGMLTEITGVIILIYVLIKRSK
ncbi:GldL-related protein [Flavobacterium sp. SUN052]|uniref:GldL-related protein n=1 Tax=Flavobacterium sp. SUN052 TaxID=3002441 RepID=UPI003FA3C248